MLFNSFEFIVLFLPLTLLLFWSVPKDDTKRIVLLAASIVFYSYWYWPYVFLMLFLVFIAWIAALYAEKYPSLSTWFVSLSLFGSLFYFKYLHFFWSVLADFNIKFLSYDSITISLPLGISFIVFQAYGYFVDVKNKSYAPEVRFRDLLLFKAFFPQLIAGPICRANQLLPQIKGKFFFNSVRFMSGVAIFSVGLLLKVFFAEGLAPQIDKLFSLPSFSPLDAFFAATGFGMQIFADFWGYSTMAVGLARMFDIDLPVNFNLPYVSTSLREFWRRWHITLSQWLRDYLYKPLGGSKHGTAITIYALFATMLLGGFWHGANYTFICWGAIHGLLLIFEHLLPKWKNESGFIFNVFMSAASWIYTFIAINVTWLFFRSKDLAQAFDGARMFFEFLMLRGDFELHNVHNQILFLVLLLWVLQFPFAWFIRACQRGSLSVNVYLHISIWILLIAFVLGSPSPTPFIYFQF